ncbi:hypothetical protein P153DRAFT_359151 [Dothidotthia symphoricarpi CBS 119687]|uniref:Uncharacterized protein n=1 Tax=Dothidotthia symphoricarpi CBS 119687 TaxID=1392245 RepID=A0A6A6A7N8_9PLEO|nr:uncharacterized protein P153DRAFT_359151 [Dothidotthia symphoricarpi CBS 119687]KAF2126808.1 hypothetical protein P153DRAFT_359151 [Dothidotthia symphoricarpi CBS 119687]
MGRFSENKKHSTKTTTPAKRPDDRYKAELMQTIDSLITYHACLENARRDGEKELATNLEQAISNADKKLAGDLAAWASTRVRDDGEEERDGEETAAGRELAAAIGDELARVEAGGTAEKGKEASQDMDMGPLQQALECFSLACGTANRFESEAPQWKPQKYRRMNTELAGFGVEYESDCEDHPIEIGHGKKANELGDEIQKAREQETEDKEESNEDDEELGKKTSNRKRDE